MPLDALPDDKLSRFLLWWINSPIGILATVDRNATPNNRPLLTFNNNVCTLVLFRCAPYQVELITMMPNAPAWPGEHRHPNVDSYECALFNCVDFTKNGVLCNEPEYVIRPNGELGDYCPFNALVRLLPTDFHGTTPLVEGAALISVQLWLNDVTPTSVGLDWLGAPINAEHAAQHAELGNTANFPPVQS